MTKLKAVLRAITKPLDDCFCCTDSFECPSAVMRAVGCSQRHFQQMGTFDRVCRFKCMPYLAILLQEQDVLGAGYVAVIKATPQVPKYLGTAQGCVPPQQPKAPLSCTASPISILVDATGSHGKRSSVGSNAYVTFAGNEAGSSSERASDGGALPSSRFLELAQLGIYTDRAPMGEGGYGSVYRCLRPGVDQWEAVKVVRFIAGNRLASRQAAEREAAILQELSDLPYILTYRGHITASRACFLFTELLQGQPMTDVFDDLIAAGTTLEQRGAAMPDFAVQLLTALAQVHARCFVHGDVTAANVFMCESAPGAGGTIKLIDFGHAQVTAFSGVCGIAVGGTPEYMAPETLEHLAGGRCAADLRKADVWSAGVVLLEAALGMRPFDDLSFCADLPRRIACVRAKQALWARGDAACELSAALAQVPATAADFYVWLLQPDAFLRPSAAEALRHPFLASRLGANSAAQQACGLA